MRVVITAHEVFCLIFKKTEQCLRTRYVSRRRSPQPLVFFQLADLLPSARPQLVQTHEYAESSFL